MQEEMAEIDRRIALYDRRVRELYCSSEPCQRLGKIEGIGPFNVTALVAAVGDRRCFKNGYGYNVGSQIHRRSGA
jgi:transposase